MGLRVKSPRSGNGYNRLNVNDDKMQVLVMTSKQKGMHTTVANSTVNDIQKKMPFFLDGGNHLVMTLVPQKEKGIHWRRLVMPHYREIDYQSEFTY